MKKYAQIHWEVADLKALQPNWTPKQCHAWLKAHARHIGDVTCEAGNVYIQDRVLMDEKRFDAVETPNGAVRLPWPMTNDEYRAWLIDRKRGTV